MLFSRFYRTHIDSSETDDRAQIISGFEQIVDHGLPVEFKLVNYYKGLPLSQKATLVDIARGVMDLDVRRQQAVVLGEVRHTFIMCDYFDFPILADVQNVDVSRMMAWLHNFTYVEILAEQRGSLRLELEEPTKAEIEWGGYLLEGRLFDLSLGGCCISLPGRSGISQGSEATLRLLVPNLLQRTLTSLEIKAQHIETVGSGRSYVSRFSMNADLQSEAVISHFMFQRQVEIIRELADRS
jgi:hypothetical protein